MSNSPLPDDYRALNKTDIVKIRRYPQSGFDPEPTTVPKEFKLRCEERKDLEAIVSKEGRIYSFTEYYQNAYNFAKALVKIGTKPKDIVSIIGFNSPEYHFALHGTWVADCITAGIYTTNSEEACKYVLNHSEATVVVCQSGPQLSKILSISEDVPTLRAIVVYWADVNTPTTIPDAEKKSFKLYTWENFLEYGASVDNSLVDQRTNAINPGSCATLIYTSGTTGEPKAVMISHDNCTYNAHAIKDTIGLKGNERIVGFLPLNHVAAQYVDVMVTLYHPVTVHMAKPDALRGSLKETLQKVKPTMFVAVPRVYEKFCEGIRETGAKNPWLLKKVSAWARGVGTKTCATRVYGQQLKYASGYSLANRLVFMKVKRALGLECCRALIVSAAPVSQDTQEFFASFDLPIYDLLGQSEATAPLSTCTPVNQIWKIGTVGHPMPGVQIEIDKASKEIMYKGRITMMGYLKMPEETLNVLDRDGFIHTGDQGVKDEDGFLCITGRIKELIITAGGENLSPVKIENTLMAVSPIISSCIAIGDRRKFISMLICLRCEQDMNGEPTTTLSKESLAVSKEIGSNATTSVEAASCPKFRAYIDGLITEANQNAQSRAACIRKWTILPLEFSITKGELTATMKLRRGIIHKLYEKEIESMFDVSNGGPAAE